MLAALLLSACGVTPTTPATATPAPAIEPLQQYMQRAGQANLEGSRDRARDLYYTAAKTYPANKEPWLKLSQDYFEARNYGQAILSAQEVLLRDPNDTVATSILAVSGLRVSASGLSALRQQQGRLGGDTRAEAEGLAKTLRDLLGEPVLVPAASQAASSSAAAKPRAPVARSRSAPAATASPSTPAAPPAAPPAPKADPSANPFNVLKK